MDRTEQEQEVMLFLNKNYGIKELLYLKGSHLLFEQPTRLSSTSGPPYINAVFSLLS